MAEDKKLKKILDSVFAEVEVPPKLADYIASLSTENNLKGNITPPVVSIAPPVVKKAAQKKKPTVLENSAKKNRAELAQRIRELQIRQEVRRLREARKARMRARYGIVSQAQISQSKKKLAKAKANNKADLY